MQRGATIDAHGICSFLKVLVTRLIVLFVIIVFWLFVTAPGRPLLLFIFAATARLAVTLLSGPLSTVLAFLLVPPLIFSPLLLSKELNLSAVLEIMALGAMDLAVLLVGVSWLLGSHQGPASGTPVNFHVRVTRLGFLGGADIAGPLDGKHGLALVLPVTALTLLRWDGGIIRGVGFRGCIFTGVVPSLFSASTPIGQNIKFGHILDLVHRQLLMHLVVAHILVECTDHNGGMNIGDVVLHPAEPLDVLAQVFPFLLGDDV